MSRMISPSHVEASGSITVSTSEQTGVIHANVTTLDAAASTALALILLAADIDPKKLTDQPIIDALAGFDPRGCQVDLLGAALDLQAMFPCDLRKLPQQCFISLRLVGAVSKFRSFFAQAGETSIGFGVGIDDTDHDSLGRPLQTFSDTGKILQMEVLIRSVGQQDRVVTPDNPIRAYAIGQLTEGGDGFFKAR